MTDLKSLTDAIQSPALKAVFRHWLDVRGARTMPAWKDIDATVIGKYLPLVWAWRFDRAQGTFIGRLAGEEILAVLGKEIRGRPLEQCFPANAASVVLARYKAVIDGPQIMRTTGHVHMKTGRHGIGERIVLPLSEDGITGDGVLGATEYRLHMGDARTLGAAIDHHHEDITNYPLS
ncbi:MAG TPA: PAS domain-containing protein [Aliidongia sp.]|uniref:PAS domain-containing protein n=1 Tax=Aliidongia sp. TaxID=1914230 RepID=UPI002DDD29AC|nr:PAS domain-containing protein [Aliidongia sp.]HEV2675813.1 PAS domain-containing protein [Aliidongia sp.]